MHDIINFFLIHSDSAHWIFFTLLVLAGFNLPINEEIIIVSSALIAANILPENTIQLYLTLIFGCLIADTIAYWIGRVVGPKIWTFPILRKINSEKILARVQDHYKKHGLLTLIIGRCIPLGVRNCVFFTAGMGKMHYLKFALSDSIACLSYVSSIFFLTFNLSKNYETVLHHLKIFNFIILTILVFFAIFLWYCYRKRKC